MQADGLESLELAIYSKLIELIESEQFDKIFKLLDILSYIKREIKDLTLPNSLHSKDKAEKLKSLTKNNLIPTHFVTTPPFEAINYTPSIYQVDGELRDILNKTSLLKESEYNWSDGSKDPREDYWRDG